MFQLTTVPSLGGMGISELNISCHYLHFTSIEDIYLKSSIPGQSSTLRVSGSTK